MFCKQCVKGILIRQYRVSAIERDDVYFDSLEKAENYYEEFKKEYTTINLKLTELLICNDCEYVSEKVLKY